MEEENGRKGVFGLQAVGRERGEEQIVISQAIRILNLSWYGVSHMHLKILDFIIKLHEISFMNFGIRFLKHFGANVELCVIDECGMKRMREVLFS